MPADTVRDRLEVLRELERILCSADFEVPDRNRRFLRHVVEETLAGRADRIKAYSIATDVFGRGADFDPQQDSIVRIEAARLRRALEHFYLKHGDPGAVCITIPKGTYVPEFTGIGAAPAHPSDAPEHRQRLHRSSPRIFVENFDQQGTADLFPAVARTFTRQVISGLTRFTELFVYGFDTTEVIADEAEGDARIPIDYRLGGTVILSKEMLRVELLMQDARDGRYVWAHGVERGLGATIDPSRVVSLCSEIAGNVAQVLALRDGVLDSQAREVIDEGPRHFSGYQKLLDFHDYWRSLDPKLFHPLLKDLEATVASDPRFSSAHACLSLLHSNAARYGYDISDTCAAPLERALDLAWTAIHLTPNSSRAYHARAVAEWFSGMPEASLATLRIARSLNPNDPELLAELGFRSAMRMEWETAVPLIEEAYRRNPLQSGQYRMGLFFYNFAEGRFEAALRETSAIDAPGIAYVHLAAAAALCRLHRGNEARARLDDALRIAPRLLDKLRDDLGFRQIHPDLIAMILEAIDDIDPRLNRRSGDRIRRSGGS